MSEKRKTRSVLNTLGILICLEHAKFWLRIFPHTGSASLPPASKKKNPVNLVFANGNYVYAYLHIGQVSEI